MLPSALMAVWWGVSSGSWQYPLMSVTSLLIAVVAQRARAGGASNKDADLARFPVAFDGSSWSIGARRLPRRAVFWLPSQRRRIYAELRAIARANAAKDEFDRRRVAGFLSTLEPAPSAWLGHAADAGNLELSLPRDGPHCLVVGPTGSGKSRLLALLISSIAVGSKVSFRLFDFKGGAALASFASDLGLDLATDLDLERASELCDDLLLLIEARERAVAAAGVASISALNNLGATRRKFEPVIVVVDEFAALLKGVQRASATFDTVSARGRSLGIHLIVANQTCSGLPRTMLTNFRQRFALAGIDPVDAVQLGFGSGLELSAGSDGWAAAAVHDSSTRRTTRFSFPLGLG